MHFVLSYAVINVVFVCLVIQIMAVIVIGQESIKSQRRRKRGTQI